MRINDSIIINSTVDNVFDVFTDLEKAAERITAINDIEILEGPANMEVGTKWKETRNLFGKAASEVMRVTELKQNHSYVVKAQSHGMKYKTTYTFVELPHETTEVNLIFEGQPVTASAKIMNLLTFLFSGATKKALHKDMEELKKVIEGQVAADGKQS